MQSFLKSGKLSNSSEKSDPSTSKVVKKNQTTPWVEKYRPKTVSEVVEQNEVVAVLQQCIDGADLPNLLFYGPPGTGKTSTILAAARQLFGDMYKDRILELNASDERGIQVIREKVRTFAQLTASHIRPDGKPCPPFKIVILDEADSMTNSAQASLRRTIEKNIKSTRFCLICNYVSRIIEPITSRCTKFQFKPIHENMIMKRLQFICKEEGVLCEEDVFNVVVSAVGGDMRRAITCLQSCSRLRGKNEQININDVYEVTGIVPEKWFNDYIEACKKEPKDVADMVDTILLEAYPASQFVEQFNDWLINQENISDKQKALIGNKLGVVSFHLQEGGSEFVQLLDLGCAVWKVLIL
ncbi:replication factor C subunit 4 isoform X2 [Agrilus planipennis]|uniref:Replication factor C subunit 4 isoform X2 n=1 Tax=Agrilus planipennis TaxID=224129 RepID=A0A7F5RMX7_AGRPL|nr:replication factor C subunit 4 isoform X2 [Agrilus planipennis]